MPDDEERLSDRLDGWLGGEGPKNLGSLIDVFGEKSFAVLFVVLLAIPALPLPTGGVTHVFELIAALLALELIAGRRQVWLPDRWCRTELSQATRRRFSQVLVKRIRWLERHSHPRLAGLLAYRLAGVLYGAVVLVLTVTAFLAPPFSGLDTLPALGVVLISLGVLLEDAVLGLVGALVGAIGVTLVFVLGRAALHEVSRLF